jgi:hypothetical protein
VILFHGVVYVTAGPVHDSVPKDVPTRALLQPIYGAVSGFGLPRRKFSGQPSADRRNTGGSEPAAPPATTLPLQYSAVFETKPRYVSGHVRWFLHGYYR